MKKKMIDGLTFGALLTLCVAWLLDNTAILLVAGTLTVVAFAVMVTSDPKE